MLDESIPTPVRTPGRRLPRFEVSIFLLVLAIVLFGAFHSFQHFWQARARAGTYQAVFITNGQVYFGKLQSAGNREVILDNVYYLQSSNAVQPAAGQPASPSSNTNVSTGAAISQTQYTLVKLGQELHGPTSRMYVNRSQILFTEDLRSDSQVIQAIRRAQQPAAK